MKKAPLKIICLVVLFLFVIFAVGALSFSGSVPRWEICEKSYNLGKVAVEIADDYLADRISIDEALKRLNYNRKLQREIVSSMDDEDLKDEIFLSGRTYEIISRMEDKKAGIDVDESISAARNELSDFLKKAKVI